MSSIELCTNTNQVLTRGFLICLITIIAVSTSWAVSLQDARIPRPIATIHNGQPAWGDAPKVQIEFVRTYSKQAGSDGQNPLASPCDVFRDIKGRVYVVDYDNHNIQVFDKLGIFIGTIGQKGIGPGDLYFPTSIDGDEEGHIYVCDQRGVKVIEDGRYLHNLFTTRVCFWSIRFLGPNALLCYDYMNPRILKGESVPLMKVCDMKGEVIREFCNADRFEDMRFIAYGNELTAAIGRDKNIYVAYDHQNKMSKFSPDGAAFFIADRPLNFKIMHKIIKEMQTSLSRGTSELVNAIKMTSISSGIGIDGQNRMWVMTYTKQPDARRGDFAQGACEFQIFSSEGVFLGRLPLVHGNLCRATMRIYGDRLFLVERFAEANVYEYKIIERN